MWQGKAAAHLSSCCAAAGPLGFIPGKLYSPLPQSDCEDGEVFEKISFFLEYVLLSCVSWRWQNHTTDLWSYFGFFSLLWKSKTQVTRSHA